MARSFFDFGNVNSLIASSQPDQAESLISQYRVGLLDGLGRTVFMDTFDNGLASWQKIGYNDAQVPELQIADLAYNENFYDQSNNIYLKAGTGTTDYSQMHKPLYLGNQNRVGLEIGFMSANNNNDVRISINFFPLGSSEYNGQIRLSMTDGEIRYYNAITSVVVATFTPPAVGIQAKSQLKMVLDFNKQEYVKVIFNETYLSLEGIPLPATGAGNEGMASAYIRAQSFHGLKNGFWLGYVRLSKDEP